MSSTPLAIVLAAGKGTRMKSDLPKVLLPVCGRPMIHFVLDALQAAGFNEKVVVIGHRGDLVREELSQRPDPITFVEQTQQLGTGHAVMQCLPHLAGHDGAGHDGPVIVVAGDSPLLQAASLDKLLAYFQAQQPALLLGTLIKDDPTGLGRIVRDAAGNFTGIIEHKDASDDQRMIREVNMSTYLFNGSDLVESLGKLENNNSQGEFYLTDCAAILYRSGRPVTALPVLQACEALSINNPDELQLVDATMRTMGYPAVTA
ncbi:MAG TPA: glycosyl transferase family 2 [Planctomycetaceae bacterium]|nr:glycosyl transferase family 2 [Planctomycetaceae bacterium]